MSGPDGGDYYRRRAEQATAMAEAAMTPGVEAIHRDMATRYAALAEAGETSPNRPMLRLAF